MKKLKLFLLCITTCVLAQAEIYTPTSLPNPKEQNRYNCVSNPDGIINDSDVKFLNRLATQLVDSTQVELCVVAVQSIGEKDAFDFCYELFQRWGIGKKGKNTGVLVFLAVESRDIRIMTGGGIEGVLTDAVCHNIIQKTAIPPMKEGDYSGGVALTALQIYEECTNGDAPEELRQMTSATNRYHYAQEEDESGWMTIFGAMGILGICVIIVWISSRPKVCPKCKQRTLRRTGNQVIHQATLYKQGKGVHIYTCKHCGYQEEKNYIIPKESPIIISGGRGGGSGFGGGSFGGGFGGGSTFGGGAGGKF
jgi:uncharacterized protein